MSVIAVVNRKGGSGKSTLSTHLAVHLASTGASVLLGDIDRQQSTRTWLRQRAAAPASGRPEIKAWAVDPKYFARPPAGADHVVLDTPGGLAGLDLARVVMYADAILMPVGNSLFDRESAADCIAEVRTLPRVASGRCRLAAIGMRLDLRTEAAGKVQAWAAEQRVSLVAVLRESNAYVRCVEQGLTLFDVPSADVEEDLAQWKPVLGWIRPLLAPGSANDAVVHRGSAPIAPPRPPAAVPLRPRIETPPHPRARVLPLRVEAAGVGAVTRPAATGTSMSPVGRLFDALPIPRFLQRTP